jgi:[ribosomal protein S18]-alanine N-acetyltransferase
MARSRRDPPHRHPQHARNGKRRDEPLCGGHAQQRRRHGPRRMIVTGFVVMMGHGFLYSVTVRGCRWRRRGNREDRAKGQGQSNRLLRSCESPILLGLRASRRRHRPSQAGEGRVGKSGREGRAPRGGSGGVLARRLHGRHLCGYLQQMRTSRLAKSSHRVHIRRGKSADLDALWELEKEVFATDRMSRRSLRRLLASPSAVAMVARVDGAIMGVAIVLFRANSRVARLYSLAVAPKYTGRGIASALLATAEKIAIRRKSQSLRLEVHETNNGAIKVYRRAGYHEFGRYHHYYQDRGNALRFEKQLSDDRGPMSDDK